MLDDFLAVERAIIQELTDQVPELVSIGSYLDLSLLGHSRLSFPSAWVGYGGTTPIGDPLAGGAIQQAKQIWHISIAVRRYDDPGSGVDVRAEAGPLLSRILGIFMGWRPTGLTGIRPFRLIGAPEPEYGDGVGLFTLSFECTLTLHVGGGE